MRASRTTVGLGARLDQLGIGQTTQSSGTSPVQLRIVLWAADLTYVSTWSWFVYVAFGIDVFCRFVSAGASHAHCRRMLLWIALEMAIWRRRRHDLTGLVHHSDRGNTAIRYRERLKEIGVMRSVGSRGDSYDNALAENVNGLYKAEVISDLWTPGKKWRCSK